MVRCGVELIGLDRIGPRDPRLAALVWSWAPDEPSAAAGHCAAWGPDARFRAADCATPHQVACRDAGGTWVVPEAAVPWFTASATCDAAGATFAVPLSGWDNERLRAAAPAGATLWLDYGETAAGWIGDPGGGVLVAVASFVTTGPLSLPVDAVRAAGRP